jgi:hypothetical protein
MIVDDDWSKQQSRLSHYYHSTSMNELRKAPKPFVIMPNMQWDNFVRISRKENIWAFYRNNFSFWSILASWLWMSDYPVQLLLVQPSFFISFLFLFSFISSLSFLLIYLFYLFLCLLYYLFIPSSFYYFIDGLLYISSFFLLFHSLYFRLFLPFLPASNDVSFGWPKYSRYSGDQRKWNL